MELRLQAYVKLGVQQRRTMCMRYAHKSGHIAAVHKPNTPMIPMTNLITNLRLCDVVF